jgi:hypothetical protein
MLRLNLAVFLLLVAGTSAFAPHARTSLSTSTRVETACTKSLVTLFAEESKKKSGLDGKMRSKLLSETIAPWRALRLFFYGALGSGAFIGGLINGSGAIAGSASPEFNLNTEVRAHLIEMSKQSDLFELSLSLFTACRLLCTTLAFERWY